VIRSSRLALQGGEPLVDHDGSQVRCVEPRAAWRPCADYTGLRGAPRPGRDQCRRVPSFGIGGQGGFTLIELLVVIIVLGLLVGLVGPRLFGRVGQSKQAAARAQIALIGAGLDGYRLDIGSYPTTSQGLVALQVNPGVTNWNGPYLKRDVPKDPWGYPYKYRCCPGQHGDYDLWSEGADGQPGGEGENADITSWETSGQQ
jgi:general secretion pathway protein G